MNAQQQEQAAFEQALADALGTGEAAPTVASTDAAAGEQATDGPIATQEASEPAAAATSAQDVDPPAPGAEPAADPARGDPAKAEPAADEDPVVLDGLKRSELHRLLSNAADVDVLRKQLDKAHGSIGDLNRRILQQAQAGAAVAAPAAPAEQQAAEPQELPPELKQFEQDYPEVAAYVKALGGPPARRQEAPPAEPAATVATVAEAAAQAGPDPVAIEVAVMDRMHEGWREKVVSPGFTTWLASQGDTARLAFDAANTAKEMSAVLGNYDQWAAARSAAADKTAKGQQRLKAAVTPAGNAPRPQAAMTEQEAFRAAIEAGLSRR